MFKAMYGYLVYASKLLLRVQTRELTRLEPFKVAFLDLDCLSFVSGKIQNSGGRPVQWLANRMVCRKEVKLEEHRCDDPENLRDRAPERSNKCLGSFWRSHEI